MKLEFNRRITILIIISKYIKQRHVKMPGDTARYKIDYILIRKRVRNQIHRSKTYPGADADNDLYLLIMKCNVVFKRLDKPRDTTMKKWNVQILKDIKSVKTYAGHSNAKLEISQADSINNKLTRIKEAVQQVSIETLKRTTINKKCCIREDILELIDERRKYKNSQDNFSKRR